MKALLASIAAVALVASPALAAPTPSTKTVTTKSGKTKATTTVTTKGNTTTAQTKVTKLSGKMHSRRANRYPSKTGGSAIAKQAKAEHESIATETKEHRAAARKHAMTRKSTKKSASMIKAAPTKTK